MEQDEVLVGDEEIKYRCVVPLCQTWGTAGDMFRLPRNNELAKLWQKVIFRPEKKDWSQARVCSEHFNQRDTFEHNSRKFLLQAAVPSLRLPGVVYQRTLSKCLNTRPVVRLKDTTNKRLKKLSYCCVCARLGSTGVHIMSCGRYTVFGKKLLHFLSSFKRNLQVSNLCCPKCVTRVEKTFRKIVQVFWNFVKTTMLVRKMELTICPACGENWDGIEQEMALLHFRTHILQGSLMTDLPETDRPVDDEPTVLQKNEDEQCKDESVISPNSSEKVAEPAESKTGTKTDDKDFKYKPVRFHYERGKWNPIESRVILNQAKALQRFRAKEVVLPGEILTCCICNGARGPNYFILDYNNPEIRIFARIFELTIYAPEKKVSNYLCENCTAVLMDVFGDFVALNMESWVSTRRGDGESLEFALRKGCLRSTCSFVPTSLHQFCSHMTGHL